MLRYALFCAGFIAAYATISLEAQELRPTLAARQAFHRDVPAPATDREHLDGTVALSKDRDRSLRILLATISSWISGTFDLLAIDDLPKIEFLHPATIAALRYRQFSGWQPEMLAAPSQPGQREVVALYDDAAKTIYLHQDWTGATAAELSVVVHETVHHIQNLGKFRFVCPQERERFALEVQERWLGLFGRDLSQDFEIDPFTLLVSTTCSY